MNLTLMSWLGVLGGVLCAVGDVLFDLKGPGNKKLGTSGNIDSNWVYMPEWRFRASIACAMIGVALWALGLWALAQRIFASGAEALGNALTYVTMLSCMGGFYVHSLVCLQCVLYKRIVRNNNDDQRRFAIADYALEGYYKAATLPFFVLYIVLALGTTGIVGFAIITGALAVPKVLLLANPIVFLIVGLAFRKVDPVRYQDLPGICMPSLGLAAMCAIGLFA